MTKSLMLSIRPEHLVNILKGKKTLELRKTVPKNFKGWVYIYITKAKPYIRELSKGYYTECSNVDVYKLNGKVVARFWFDEYDMYYFNEYQHDYRLLTSDGKIFRNATIPKEKVCLTCVSINDYGKGQELYAWHIKDLEIFKEPMDLSKFYKLDIGKTESAYIRLKRAPRSWQYVYVEGEEG